MAFHVACPITCRRICDCELGFPAVLRGARGRGEFLEEVARVEEFLRDPWTVKTAGGGAVQVLVPRVVPPPPAQPPAAAAAEDGADREELPSSALARRAALQRKALAESMAAEDYIRRMEAGGAAEVPGEETANVAGEDQSSLTAKVMCRICFSGENEGSDRAIKMLSCKLCSKKYHRSCLKIWAEYRDLFHWSSWTCPACRICEVCRRTGDPSKLMYCKRCDGAYHCYCQQPPHKNVSHGPFLCPKHTRCHSCGSAVPGNGHSTRWFLGYTCCDACGRLFVKGNFCPVCLKVYRDSEPTPMVCCDVCQQWVHCECDGISDEKYQQFQADGNLYYKCAACRGDCYQVKDIDDAVRELWKRRDKADRGQIASLRAAAGLPSQEELFSIFPFSDDEESCPVVLKNDHGKSLKFSVKGLIDKSSNTTKEYGKNISKNLSSNKKYPEKGYQIHLVCKSQEPHQSVDTQHEARSLESGFRDQRIGGMESYKSDGLVSFSCPLNSVPDDDKAKFQIEQRGGNNHSVTKEHVTNSIHKVSKVKIKGSKSQGLQLKVDAGKNASKSGTMKGTKLVIHIGAKSRNSTSSPRSEASSCHKEQDLAASNGCEDTSQLKAKDNDNYILDELGENVRNDGPKGVKLDNATNYATNMRNSKHGDRGSSLIKLGKVSDIQRRSRANIDEGCELMSETRNPLIMSKRRTDESPGVEASADAAPWINEAPPRKQSLEKPINLQSKVRDAAELLPPNSTDDPKPLLKLKFKNPYFEQRSSWAAWGVEEKNSVKGQRSKRKRPASMEKVGTREDGSCTHVSQENPIDEAIDANWILQKLGKDAIGKRVEVHQSSDNSWHRGVVSDIMEGTSSLSVRLDDGRSRTLELGKQGVRFISQKQKRTKL